jgi:hypothetical protein
VLIQTLLNINDSKQQARDMSDNNNDFSISEYSNEPDVVSGFTSSVTGIFANLKNFTMRMRDEQAEARQQENRKREMINQVRQESIKRMPLEKLIRMGFYHF